MDYVLHRRKVAIPDPLPTVVQNGLYNRLTDIAFRVSDHFSLNLYITPLSPNNSILFLTHLSMNFLLSLALGMMGSSMLSAKVTIRYSHCPVWLVSIRWID